MKDIQVYAADDIYSLSKFKSADNYNFCGLTFDLKSYADNYDCKRVFDSNRYSDCYNALDDEGKKNMTQTTKQSICVSIAGSVGEEMLTGITTSFSLQQEDWQMAYELIGFLPDSERDMGELVFETRTALYALKPKLIWLSNYVQAKRTVDFITDIQAQFWLPKPFSVKNWECFK